MANQDEKMVSEELLDETKQTVEGEQVESDQVEAEMADTEEASEAEAEEADTKDAKASRFSRKKDKKEDKKEEAFKVKIDELEDRVKRQMAEFDNFRKRTDKEKTAMFDTGARSVIEKILPVVDNFERGLDAIGDEDKGSAFADGMSMIYKQLMTELDKMDVKPIEAVGQEFNPDFHNAVSQVESDEYESGVIVTEFQKGYTYHDVVIRHSMVVVAQ